MASEPIELSLSESFTKHKRNLLFVCAIIFVLAAASPPTVELPVVGSSNKLPAPIAYLLLGGTLVYFFTAYIVELLTVRARNSEAAASSELESVSSRLSAVVEPVRKDVASISNSCRAMQRVVSQLPTQVDEETMKIPERFSNILNKALEMIEHVEPTLDKEDQHNTQRIAAIATISSRLPTMEGLISSSVGRFNDDLRGVRDTLGHIEKNQEEIVRLSGIAAENSQSLLNKFDRISGRIRASQRFGFFTLEQGVPILLSISSLIFCVDGYFFTSVLAKGLRILIL